MTKYTDRAITPLGKETGLTSTPVSLRPSRANSPKFVDPYVYQPAAMWTHPEAVPGPTTNYLQAVQRRKGSLNLEEGLRDEGMQTVEGEVVWRCVTEEEGPGVERGKLDIKWSFEECPDRKAKESNGVSEGAGTEEKK